MFQKCKFIEITFVYAGTLTSIPIEWEKKKKIGESPNLLQHELYAAH